MEWRIVPGVRTLKGKVPVPPDKSISHRAAMFSAITSGSSRIENFLFAEDCVHTVEALRKLGVEIKSDKKALTVQGVGLKGLKPSDGEIYLGNSGTTMRILPGILAGQDIDITLTGDSSLQKRPMGRIIEPLTRMGASITALGVGKTPPLRIGPAEDALKGIEHESAVASAQVKSCILLAGLYATGSTTVKEPYSSRDHTERMLTFLGANITCGNRHVTVRPSSLKPRDIRIPNDISSAAFFIVAGLITSDSQLYFDEVGINPTRVGVLNVLQRMGGKIILSDIRQDMEPVANIQVSSSHLRGTVISAEEVPALIDEVPILAVAAAFAEGETVFEGISELKVKESDRVEALLSNFDKLGIEASERGGTLIVTGRPGRELNEAELDSFNDHRIAMSMAICAMASPSGCKISDVECVSTSYPDFYEHIENIIT